MRLRKCLEHGYTLEENCKECGKKTKEAHYKFLKTKEISDKKDNFYYSFGY